MRKPRFEKYALYERFVQSPEAHALMVLEFYKGLFGRYPQRLREDFCGTFAISAAWVSRNRKNQAVAIDLDPEPIAYGTRHHLAKLTPAQKKRLKILRQDVRRPTAPRCDLILAGNFSFNVFHERRALVDYFRAARRSLKPGHGAFILEVAGGPGMIAKTLETKSFPRGARHQVLYQWDQQSFDPVTHHAKYAIHFKRLEGKKVVETLSHAFRYDWRLWTLPELRDALLEAGFKEALTFWESEHRGRGTGEYAPVKEGDNAYSWIAYMVGIV